jgi:hypothetical protein
MDPTLGLLKKEINQVSEMGHDLVKWKLGVTAALGVAAFGLTKDSNPNYWMLLLVPFVCAYIDLHAYQGQLRIQVIAWFLREHGERDPVLQKYEKECDRLRGPRQHFFSLDNWAAFGCSIGASLLAAVFYFLRSAQPKVPDIVVVPPLVAKAIFISGAVLVVFFWLYLQYEVGKISAKVDPPVK